MAGIFINWEGRSYTWDSFVADLEGAINLLGKEGPFFCAHIDAGFVIANNHLDNLVLMSRHGARGGSSVDLRDYDAFEYTLCENWDEVLDNTHADDCDTFRIALEIVREYAKGNVISSEECEKMMSKAWCSVNHRGPYGQLDILRKQYNAS
jgi:hypothetical protein